MNAPAMQEWKTLLDAAIENEDITKVAERMKISRPYVSRVASGHIPQEKVPVNFIKRVMDTFDSYGCPHMGIEVTRNDCKSFAYRDAPTSSAREARHWRACQGCPLKPAQE